jgi:glycosyltransferase involved in cell wall biosynthesis
LSGGDLNRGRLRGSGRDGALLVDPRDINSIADGIYRGLTDAELRSELIERGLARARHFTWNASAQQTIALFASMRKEAGTEAGPRTLEGRSP